MRFESKSQNFRKPRFANRIFVIGIFLAGPWLCISKDD
jgi:hypothetical protein